MGTMPTMQLLDSLRREHDLIEEVALSLLTYAKSAAAPEEDGPAYLRFFDLYVGRFHHGREEDVLFPALAEATEAPADRGPIPVLLRDHEVMAGVRKELAHLLSIAPGRRDAARLGVVADRFVRALLLHIDAENGVLYPESEARFRRASVLDLPDRAPDAEEEAAAREAAALITRHRPARLPDLIRGGSCAACPFFGAECEGVERAWSSDLEWDDMIDRVG